MTLCAITLFFTTFPSHDAEASRFWGTNESRVVRTGVTANGGCYEATELRTCRLFFCSTRPGPDQPCGG